MFPKNHDIYAQFCNVAFSSLGVLQLNVLMYAELFSFFTGCLILVLAMFSYSAKYFVLKHCLKAKRNISLSLIG
jgi:hypothetical protein